MHPCSNSRQNSFCINPMTGRPVRIGGLKWRELVRNNSISPREEADNVVYRIKSNAFETDNEAINHLQEEKEKLISEIRAGKHRVPTDTNVVRKGTTKLVYQRKKLTISEIVNKSVTAACHILDEIRQGSLEIDEDLPIAQRQAFIANAIVARMASPPAYHQIPPIMPTICRSVIPPRRPVFETDTENSSEYSSSEEEEYGFG